MLQGFRACIKLLSKDEMIITVTIEPRSKMHYILFIIVFMLSISLAYLMQVNETWRAVFALPAVGALLLEGEEWAGTYSVKPFEISSEKSKRCTVPVRKVE